MKKVVVTAVKVEGHCSAGIKPGDKFVLEGSTLNLRKTDVVCPFALTNIYPIIFAARLGFDIAEIGLKERVVQCIDPGAPYTEGGTVFFRVETADQEKAAG